MRRATIILAILFALIVLAALAGCTNDPGEPAVDLGPVTTLMDSFWLNWFNCNFDGLVADMNATVQYAEGATVEFQTMAKEDAAAKFTPAWWDGTASPIFWKDTPEGTSDAATITAHLATSAHEWNFTFGVTNTATGWLIAQIRVVQLR